ncbi:chemotaxis protein [Burkholderia sp. Leaf177]|uniref:methyl-accepting chemotaxis protein n=1 Tax=Burkholderia sp. Leaf177 TaxID=1736287 RepID=UPI0006F8CBAD|nr:methyl-accepting chemotaxis protein [Burkholderia sp. Leaf177]KQR77128.1 chemotaxis protein [Burkholderia sp. Leaf177]
MKLFTKLLILVGIALLGIVLLAGTALQTLHAALVKSRRDEIVVFLTKAEHLVNAYKDLETRGTMSHDQAQQATKESLSRLNANPESYFWVHSADGTVLVHQNEKFVGTKARSGLSESSAYGTAMAKSHFALVDEPVMRSPGSDPVPKLQGVVFIRDWNWWVGTGFFYDDINAMFNMLMLRLGVIAVVIVAAVAAIAWTVLRSVKSILGGEPADAMAVASEIANGNLSVEFDTGSAPSGSLLAELGEMRLRLITMIAEIHAASQSIALGSGEIAQGNLNLSQRTEEQAASLQETASSMERLTLTVKQNADNAREAKGLVNSTTEATLRGKSAVEAVVLTMKQIADQSTKVAVITSVIESIAFQTNILALNAAVEAARAGEEGRGFAVVASEVRTLAQRSASAANDIKQLIQVTAEKVTDGNRLVEIAGERMSELVKSIGRVSTIIGEITAASDQQSVGIEQVSRAVTDMDEVTQHNAALVEQAAAAASSLDEQAGRLRSAVSVFQLI